MSLIKRHTVIVLLTLFLTLFITLLGFQRTAISAENHLYDTYTHKRNIFPQPKGKVYYERLVDEYATAYGVSAYQMKGTIECESGWNPNAEGDSGRSIGLVQIHLPAHPATDEEARAPEFAILFMAENFSRGNQHLWTCWRDLYL